MSAKPTNKTTHPPSEAVWWLCIIHGGRCIHVKSRLWIDARKEAAKQAGCSPDSILCVMDTVEDAKERAAAIRVWNEIIGRSDNSESRLRAWQSGLAAR